MNSFRLFATVCLFLSVGSFAACSGSGIDPEMSAGASAGSGGMSEPSSSSFGGLIATSSVSGSGGMSATSSSSGGMSTTSSSSSSGSGGMSTGPTVINVSSTKPDGTYAVGTVIPIVVIFSAPVNVIGTPQLTLETGFVDEVVNYSSGSGTKDLTFKYVVAAANFSADLDYVSPSALILNGGSIKDAASNNAVLTLPAPGTANSLGANKNIVIDTSSGTGG